MTIEGQPVMKTDYEWQESYYNQRRDKLADIIGDYINDETIDPRQCYEEILSEIDGWIKYYKNFHDRSVKLKSLLLGNREFDLDSFDPVLASKWQVDKILLTED